MDNHHAWNFDHINEPVVGYYGKTNNNDKITQLGWVTLNMACQQQMETPIYANEGESCGGTNPECTTGLTCTDGTCIVPLAQQGENCNSGIYPDCSTGLTCSSDGVCIVPPAQEGESCGGTNPDCSTGLTCSTDGVCIVPSSQQIEGCDPNNPDCPISHYNYTEFEEVCNLWGYTYEAYNTYTDDGWYLTIFQITGRLDGSQRQVNPNATNPVLFQHGALEDAHLHLAVSMIGKPWVLSLYDAGYEVFLGNNRGTKYSS